MQDNYTFLLSVYEKVLDMLRPGVCVSQCLCVIVIAVHMYVCVFVCVCVCAGVKLCDVYNETMEKVERERPELKDHLTRNVG